MATVGRDVEAPDRTFTLRLADGARTVAQRVAAVPVPVVLGALIAISAALRVWAALRVVTPWIYSDEITYSELGRNLYLDGHLAFLGRPIGFLSLLYPAFVGLPLTLGDVGTAYALLKGLQAVAMSLTAVPVYLWSRRLVSPRWALTASLLTLALPGLAYAGVIMSEVVFVPVVTVAAWAMAVAVARPSLRSQLLVAGAIALAVATRLQAVILLPAFATAVVVHVALDRRRPRQALRVFAPTIVLFAGLAGLWLAYRVSGGHTAGALGGYRDVLQTTFDPHEVAKFVLYHAADVVLITALLPAAALIMLALQAFRRDVDAEVKAYVAVAVSLVVWTVLEVGAFAQHYVGHLAERNLLPLAPVLFVGFVAWLARGAYRPRYAVFLTAVALFALLSTVPLSRFVGNTLPDALMLVPFQKIQLRHPAENLDVLLPYLALPLLALFAFVPRRQVWLLPAVVFGLLVYTSVSVSGAVADISRFLAPHLYGSSKDWVDRAARGPVGYVYAGDDFNPLFGSVFWNRRIRNLYSMRGTPIPGPMPQTTVAPSPRGLLGGVSEQYVLAKNSLVLGGTPVAAAPSPGLTLWHVDGRPELSAWLAGVDVQSQTERGRRLYAVGVMGQVARLTFYDCRGGTLRVTLIGGDARTVTVSGGAVDKRVHLRLGKPGTAVVRTSGDGRRCEFTLTTSPGFVQVRPLVFTRR
jgi:hypothetical protein